MNQSNNSLKIAVIVVVVLAAVGILFYRMRQTQPPASSGGSTATSTQIVYRNTQYGFTFSLPADWNGYSIVTSTWHGQAVSDPNQVGPTGPIISIRNPLWTAAQHYEDIPIMIFTIAQWNEVSSGTIAVSAAPFPPSELGRNNKYVFGLPARYNYDYATGYQEVADLLQNNSLQTFNL